MTLYSGQVLRIDQVTGETSATYLTVTDDDSVLQSREAGTIWDICGSDLPAPPVLDSRLISGTLLDGSAYNYTAAHFTARGKDFYLLPAENAPEAVATIASSMSSGPITPLEYLSHGLTIDDEPLLTNQALSVIYNAHGKAVVVGSLDVTLMDDDGLIQFNGANGASSNETGVAPQILVNTLLDRPMSFNIADLGAGGLSVSLVRVFYSGSNGNDSMVALRFAIPTATGEHVLYFQRGHAAIVTDIFGVRSEKALAESVDGLSYSDFGFGHYRLDRFSGDTGQFLQGFVFDDFMQGNGGNDTLVGGLGADSLDGGTGNDILHGGAQNDTMIGQSGNDALYGGNDRDRMYGGANDDVLIANWGNDTLYGGDGNDKISAGSDNDLVSGGAGNDNVIGFDGNDRLLDGSGADQLNGGIGADMFVMSRDATTDRILDFEDGVDLIDLSAAFATLTITTVATGQVQIISGADTLLVFDAAHHLTAASLTAADFI